MTSTRPGRCRGPRAPRFPSVLAGTGGWLVRGLCGAMILAQAVAMALAQGQFRGSSAGLRRAVPCSPWSSAPRARSPSRGRCTSQASTVAVIRAADSQADLIAKSCEGNLPMPRSSRCGYVFDPDVDPVGVDVAGFAPAAQATCHQWHPGRATSPRKYCQI
jgi:hypothetical protein